MPAGAIIRHDCGVSARPIILDCDPGVDDGVALLLALAVPDEIEVLAITTVAGNVPLDLTARNARILRTIAEREDVPVFAGATRPLVRSPAFEAEHGPSAFHGETGLGSLPLVEPGRPLATSDATDAIIRIVFERPAKSVTLVAVGPLTNIALAILKEPRLAGHLRDIAIMGGARSAGGNITASAEFNIYADPDAAAVVFASTARIVAFGLDVTHQVRTTPDRIARIAALGTPQAAATADLLSFAHGVAEAMERDGAPIHDPCPIVWLLAPHLFAARHAMVQVETASDLTRGHTAVEFRVDPAIATVSWMTGVDADGVFAILEDRLAKQ